MILDTTLREGLQSLQIHLSMEDRTELVHRLGRCGVAEMEIGWAGRGENLSPLVQAALEIGTRAWVWSRARPDSLDEAARSGAQAVSICFPASRHHQQERFGLATGEVLDWLQETIAYALDRFEWVQVGWEDASRADRSSLSALVGACEVAGASRVRVADTVGILSPTETSRMIRGIRQVSRMPLGIHLHNDLGMATANAVSALEAGANFVDTCLLGLGERAGIAATEELVAWAVIREGKPFDLAGIREACHWLSRRTGLAISPSKAVAGADVFTSETGIHVEALSLDPTLYEPWDPSRSGHDRGMLLGAKSGRAAVRTKLAQLGIPEPADLEALVDGIREEGARLRRPLRDDEIPALALVRAA